VYLDPFSGLDEVISLLLGGKWRWLRDGDWELYGNRKKGLQRKL
jgi:hypothetical protein